MRGRIFSINISKTKGIAKTPVEQAVLLENFGLESDIHAGDGIKQVSLLSMESISKQQSCPKVKDKDISLKPGDFAENITTEGIMMAALKIGDKVRIGKDVILEISKIGKDCHRYCAIYYKLGDCIMPREGVFARVIKGGLIKKDDTIEVMGD